MANYNLVRTVAGVFTVAGAICGYFAIDPSSETLRHGYFTYYISVAGSVAGSSLSGLLTGAILGIGLEAVVNQTSVKDSKRRT